MSPCLRPELALLLLVCWARSSSAYGVGDYVPMARQAQFHNLRTQWHDIIGRHCPRFGVDREALLPIPRPLGFAAAEDVYKLKLSFGTEKFVTGWLPIMSRKMGFAPPYVQVQLTYFAGELRGVKASVTPLPDKFMASHKALIAEYMNETAWPKHVLLQYRWRENTEVDVTAGLVLLFGASFALTTLLAVYILQSSQDKFARFMSEQLAETPMMPMAGAMGADIPKVD